MNLVFFPKYTVDIILDNAISVTNNYQLYYKLFFLIKRKFSLLEPQSCKYTNSIEVTGIFKVIEGHESTTDSLIIYLRKLIMKLRLYCCSI